VEERRMISRETWYAIGITGILTIPLNLATTFLFPRVQQWLDARSKARAFRKSNQMKKEYEEAYYFVLYPHRMTHYFLNRGIEIFRLGLFLLILTVLLIYGPPQPTVKTQATTWLGLMEGISFAAVYMFLILVITQSVNKLHEIYYRVEFWGEYQKKVALDLPDIEIKPLPAGR
jgi:hypothetical protein